jgi:sugar phosphate isomerase/epimerase
MKSRLFTLFILALGFTISLNGQDRPRNPFYAQCTFTTLQDPPELEKVALILKEAGYDGIEAWGESNYYETLKAADKAGISFIVNYVPLLTDTHEDYLEWKATTRKMISSSPKGTLFCFHVPDLEPAGNRKKTDKIVVEELSDMADHAANYEVRICTYPHFGDYCETASQSVKFAKAVGKPNCGAMITLCHLLKVEGTENISKTIRKSSKYLFAVTISGADDGNTIEMDWDKVIQPLGQGTFDVYHFLEQLWDSGYEGPIGVQYYGIKADARSVILSSIDEWQKYKERYIQSHNHDKDQ